MLIAKTGGGFINKKKKAFTLIELLAIIVILAIIAVITVPIILNIIENSKKGAATDSAYGYKDAVNKWYVQELSKPNNQNFMLNETYTITDGNLGSNEIPVSGDKPTSGTLTYSNNTLTNGCLTIGDYKITFTNGEVSSTVKGDCSDYVDSNNNPTIASCPECKFIYTTTQLVIGTDTIPTTALDDYTKLTSSHPFFLGLVANPSTGIISRAFVCGVEGTTPFCLEGYDTSQWDSELMTTFETVFDCSAENYDIDCEGSTVSAGVTSAMGGVYVTADYTVACKVDGDGKAYCGQF